MADPTKPGPDTPSGAYSRSIKSWQMIADIREGVSAIRDAGATYLPRFNGETTVDYDRRKLTAPWRPEFADAFGGLVAKPFTRDIAIENGDSPAINDFAEDVDTRGNNLTQFAKVTFENGLADGFSAILVDKDAGNYSTIAEERQAGARAYFVQVKATNLLAVYFAKVKGKIRPVYVRIKECVTERDGFAEKEVEQIREIEPKAWRVWRQNDKKEWGIHQQGITTFDFVPMAFFYTGQRDGDYCVRPPLLDLAEMQIELYRALVREDEILTYAGYPMLTGNGFLPPEVAPVVGPRTILYAPPGESATSWDFIQPAAENIKEVREKVQSIIEDMRRVGMQPMTQKSGTVSATATSVEGARAHSVLQAWAFGLKDCIEQAFVLLAGYGMAGADKVEASVFTDFMAEPFAQAPLTTLTEARKLKDISGETYRLGLKRFAVLPSDMDEEAETERLAGETEDLMPEQPIDPITGQPIQNANSGSQAGSSGQNAGA